MQQRIKRSIAKGDKKRRQEYENILNRLDVMKNKFAKQYRMTESIMPEIELFLKNYFAAHPFSAQDDERFKRILSKTDSIDGIIESSLFKSIMFLKSAVSILEKLKIGNAKSDESIAQFKKEFPDNHVPILAIDEIIKVLEGHEGSYSFSLSSIPAVRASCIKEIAFIKEHYNDVFAKYSVPELQN